MPFLGARDEIAMPAASGVIGVIGDWGKLNQAGCGISADEEVCGVARAQPGARDLDVDTGRARHSCRNKYM